MKYTRWQEILENVKQYIKDEELICENDNILIGVSGGIDSICLLHMLNDIKGELNFNIALAHINHGLREESIEETNFVQQLSKKLNIECYILKTDAAQYSKENKISIEMAGRNLRYGYFEKICKDSGFNKVAIAHNLNDKAETIILNIIRGAGINGLVGIKAKNNNIIRPLLGLQRKDIEEYIKIKEYKYYEDSSNNDTIYARNKVRLDLIKKIENEYNPSIIETLDRLAKSARQDINYLERIATNLQSDIILNETESNITIDRANYIVNDISIRKRILFNIISKLLTNVNGIENKHIDSIDILILKGIKNKQFIIGNKFIVKVVSKKEIEICISE